MCSAEMTLTRQVAHRGLRERFASPSEDPADLDACRHQLHPIIAELVARAHAEGSLRTDVTADDIALLLIGLGRITEVTDGSTPGAWRRQLDLVLDGLRAPTGANAIVSAEEDAGPECRWQNRSTAIAQSR